MTSHNPAACPLDAPMSQSSSEEKKKAERSNIKQLPLGFYFDAVTRGFHIVARMKNVPGALYDLLGRLQSSVDFVNSTCYSLGDGSAIWSGFGRSLLEDDTEGRLKELIEWSPFVLECEVKGSDHGLLVDTFHSGLEVAPDRLGIIIPIAGVAQIFDRSAQTYGSAGKAILFQEGSSLGKESGHYLNAMLGHGDFDWKVKALLAIYRAYGWGSAVLEVGELGTRFRVTVRDCFECAEMGRARQGCDFLRGHLASAISALSGKQFEGKETKCRLRGGPSCEFLLTRKEREEQRDRETDSDS